MQQQKQLFPSLISSNPSNAILLNCIEMAVNNITKQSLVSGLNRHQLLSYPISIKKLDFSTSKKGASCRPIISSGRRVLTSAVSTEDSSPRTTLGLLAGYDDEYGGVVIEPESLPSSVNAFAFLLHASLFDWRLKGKKGVWLKILTEQADLVPIAIKEGFNFHHAEPGYVMLTYWIPNEPCMLPDSPSHQIGVGAFVINENREVLVVKEKHCPCRCAGLWKLPTGYINKSEELFSGAVREVKEETGVDTEFEEVIAFRHAHRLAFEKSDLLFLCMLKPLSSDIAIDEKEILAAKWMDLEEFVAQPFFQEDPMLKMVIAISIATYENRYHGFKANQLISKFDGQLSFLYYNDL